MYVVQCAWRNPKATAGPFGPDCAAWCPAPGPWPVRRYCERHSRD